MGKNLLKGKRGIIFGALDENSIAWTTAKVIHDEGGEFVLTNAPIAMRLGKIDELAAMCGAVVVPADATSIPDLENLIAKSVDELGGKLDFVLHSIGMSPNVRKGKAYGDLNYEWMQKSLDISAISFHKVMQTCEKLDAMNEWGSIIALSYVAAQRTYPDYSDMAQAKAMLESIARSYGERFGQLKNVRVNTISQSPTMTRAGTGVGGFYAFLEFAKDMSPLGNASVEACANYIAIMFSDYTRMVTMQNLMHDGGFSNSGMTQKVIDKLLLAK